jgi:bifunctional non-homologous end joining protein LigD/DNA ligase-1
MTDLFESKSIAPMLIEDEKPAFDSPDYLYELKLDGIRCVAYLDKSGAVLRNKRNKDVTAIYPELGMTHKQIRKRCILDGEVFILKDGRAYFYEIQRRALMANSFKISLAAARLPASFVAFDILYLDGEQLTERPLLERKELLQNTVSDSERMAVSRYIVGNGVALYDAAEKQGHEGIVAKRMDSLYYFGKRTKDWSKCKALKDEDFVICGYYYKGSLASIILGAYSGNRLVYQSHVVMGVSKRDFKIIAAQISMPKSLYPGFPDFPGAVWIAPSLVCTVKFMERTRNGGLRQPQFKGLRDDKAPEDCTI